MLGPKEGEGQQVKQIRLTETQVQRFISAQAQLARIADKLEAAGHKPDPTLQAQIEQIAKSSGFASVEDMDDVAINISLVLDGLDPQTGQFVERPEQVRRAINEVEQDTQMAQDEKNQVLAELREELKSAAPLQFKENVALVKKYQKQFEALQQEPEQKGPETRK